MTENEWLWCKDPEPMLESSLRDKVSERKLRLFGCACCRRIWPSLDHMCRTVIDTAERYADGLVATGDVVQSRFKIASRLDSPARACAYAADLAQNAVWAARSVANATSWSAADARLPTELAKVGGAANEHWHQKRREAAHHDEQACQAALLRHIVGNPFCPYPAPGAWPSTVVQLADALYNGQDCGFALHDALLEAGHPELAEHFRQEQTHPKGCWVVDLVLGKS